MTRHGLFSVLLAVLIACPLFAWPGVGYDAVRLPAVLGLVTLMLVLLFIRSSRSRPRPPGPAPLRTAGFILLAVQLLSLLGARSVADGIPSVLILFAGVSAFACLRAGAVGPEAALRMLPVFSAVGLVFAGIGLGQSALRLEAVSTEGNRNYAGAVASMLIPLTVALTRRGAPWSRMLAGLSSLGLLLFLLLTAHRGGLVAATAGLLITAAAMRAKRVPRGGRVAGLAIVAVLGMSALFQGEAQLSAERGKTARFRLDVWKSALAMVGARPVFGWGAGSFETEYPPYRSGSEFRYSHEYEPTAFKELEDAHSSWVETSVDTGLAGVLALGLIAYVAARLWRYGVKVAPDAERAAALAGLGGGAAAYLIAGLFNTLTLKTSPTLLFWIYLGLIELLGDVRPWRSGSGDREARVAVPAAAALLAAFGTIWAALAGMADGAFTRGMTTSKPEEREARMREALDLNPHSWRARSELARTLLVLGRFQGAADEGRATLRLRPHQVEVLNLTASAIVQAGGDAGEAAELLRHAAEIAPFYSKSFYNLGVLELRRGRAGEARADFTRALELNPVDAAAYYCRGSLEYAAGEAPRAVEDFRKAKSLGYDVAAALRAEHPQAAADPRFSECFK